MKNKLPYAAGLVTLTLIPPAAADVIYSSLQQTITTDYTGVTATVGDGTFNAFFGDVGVANNNNLQPLRLNGTGLSTIKDFGSGVTIGSGSGALATGAGGSFDHLGTQFTDGTEGYVGFKLDSANYGWMRVVLTNNTSTPVTPMIKDWAYDNTGAAIRTGWIKTDIVTGTTRTVTLNPGTGESFTLGSQLTNASGSITNSVVKNGAGTTILIGSNTYSGTTAINVGVLSIAASASTGSGAVTVNNTGTKLMGAGTVGGNTTVNSGAILAPGNAGVGKVNFSGDLSASSGSIFEWELAATPAETGRGTSYDAVNVAGTLGGSSAIFRVVLDGAQDFSASFWDTNRTWTDIFKTADAGSNVDIASVFSGLQYYNSTGDLGTPSSQGHFTISGSSLTWSAVPEPTSALAGILLGSGLLRPRRNAPQNRKSN